MRKVLVIAHQFPPLTGGDVRRILGFIRHLPANGWRPTVICADGDTAADSQDATQLLRIPHEATVVRVPSGWSNPFAQWAQQTIPSDVRQAFSRLSPLPDRYASWGTRALRVASRIIQGGRFTALYSTGPAANHWVATAVRARTGLPWIADISTPHSCSDEPPPIWADPGPLNRTLQNLVWRQADRLIVNTPGHQRWVQATLGGHFDKVAFIPNGFAESDFAKPRHSLYRRHPLIIGCMGSAQIGCHPDIILPWLAHARLHAPSIRLRCIATPALPRLARRAGLGDLVDEVTPETQAEALDQLGECHATIIATPAAAAAAGFIPQALYLYLRLGRPLVALFPPSDAANLVLEAGPQPLLQDPDHISGPSAGGWLHQLAAGRIADTPRDAWVVQRHARDVLTQRLASVLNDVVRAASTDRP